MPDVQVTNQTWLQRLGGSLLAALFGFIIFVAAFPLEFWNEGRAIAEFKALSEGAKSVLAVDAAAVNQVNDGKLVYVTGQAVTDEKLADDEFGVSIPAIKLRRGTEMYQWDEREDTETRKKLGGGSETKTTYSYDKEWADHVINSSTFHSSLIHKNPGAMLVDSKDLVANDVKVGAFRLDAKLISKMNSFQPLELTSKNKIKLSMIGSQPIHVLDGYVYIGEDPADPRIGDTRVKFSYVPMGQVSVVARQFKDAFEPYVAKNGTPVELLQCGTVSADNMFKEAERESNMLTWGCRVLGFFMMFIGLSLLAKPLSVAVDLLPFLGDLVGFTTGIAAFGAALLFSLLTISIGWVFYRPLVGVAIASVGVALGVGIMRTASKRAS